MDFDSSFCKAVFREDITDDSGEIVSDTETSSWSALIFVLRMGEILIMLVNQFVVSTEMAVLNVVEIILCGKPTAATGVTLILQPAIVLVVVQ